MQVVVTDARALGLLPKEKLTEHELEIYKIYSLARECISGSMVDLYTKLEMTNDEFFHRMDSDVEFNNAIMHGLRDSRGERLLQLESALINLALGGEVVETKVVENDEGIETTTYHKKTPPNLSALQVLLEKYEGSSWAITEKVKVEVGQSPQEIDYSLLTKSQLKALAYGKGDRKK